jgi:hypothetical protein
MSIVALAVNVARRIGELTAYVSFASEESCERFAVLVRDHSRILVSVGPDAEDARAKGGAWGVGFPSGDIATLTRLAEN